MSGTAAAGAAVGDELKSKDGGRRALLAATRSLHAAGRSEAAPWCPRPAPPKGPLLAPTGPLALDCASTLAHAACSSCSIECVWKTRERSRPRASAVACPSRVVSMRAVAAAYTASASCSRVEIRVGVRVRVGIRVWIRVRVGVGVEVGVG